MTEELDLLKRRLERERLARKQAEQIAEEKSRELFLKGQTLQETLLKERATRQELATLLTTLEGFASKLDEMDILRVLHEYLNYFIESQATSLYLLEGDAIHVIHFQDDQPEPLQEWCDDRSMPFGLWKDLPGFDEPSVLTREAVNDLQLGCIRLQPGTTCLMVLPLTSHTRRSGYLVVENHRPGAFNSDQIRPSLALVNQATVALENARLYSEVENLSRTDPLTGIRNRRGFEEEARRSLEIAIRYKKPLSVLMFDIDYFKKVNDTYGHSAGDVVLVQVAETARKTSRAGDLLARLGGEEFCLLLPETQASEAFLLGERLRTSVAGLSLEAIHPGFRVTVSIGVAGCLPAADSLEALLDRSDQALYKAKESGRNRVCSWEA